MARQSWPYLSDSVLSEAMTALDSILDEVQREDVERAANKAHAAITKLFDLSTVRDGFRFFEADEADEENESDPFPDNRENEAVWRAKEGLA